MTLYFLEWDNGLEYEDDTQTLVGVYSSNSLREEAKKRYSHENWKKQWPFCSGKNGKFLEYELYLNENLIRKAAAVWGSDYEEENEPSPDFGTWD